MVCYEELRNSIYLLQGGTSLSIMSIGKISDEANGETSDSEMSLQL